MYLRALRAIPQPSLRFLMDMLLAYCDDILQEDRSNRTTASNPIGSSIRLRKKVLGAGTRK